MTDRNSEIPRAFNFDKIGKGEIVEEAGVEYDEWAPTIQVLEFENGQEVLRFCYYTQSGKLAPRALYLDKTDIANLREEIKNKPLVKKFIQNLLTE